MAVTKDCITAAAEDKSAKVAEIHKAIRSQSFRWLADDCLSKVSHPQHLLWKPNSLGWTAIHVAASCHDIPLEWWEYLLHQAGSSCNCPICYDITSADRSGHDRRGLARCQTDLGHSTTDLFFRTWLEPLPWQRDLVPKSQRLVKALNEMLNNNELWIGFLECLERQRKVGASPSMDAAMDDDDDDPLNDLSCNIVIQQTAHFWHRMEVLMLRVDFPMDNNVFPYYNCTPTHRLVCRLALTDCPKVVADIAIRMTLMEFENPTTMLDSPGRLPLHIWAKSDLHQSDQWARADAVDDKGCLDALLQVWPEATSMTALPDDNGPLPLHTALAQGKSWRRLRALYRAYPEALYTVDKSTALSPFCLAALSHETIDQAMLCARQTVGGKFNGMWYYLSKTAQQEAAKHGQDQLNAEQLTTIYEVLRAFPSAVVATAAFNE